MNGTVINIAAAVVCLPLVVGCAVPGPRVPIIKPQLIDQKAATEKLISAYCGVVAKTERMGFEIATATCRRVQTGDIKLAGVKSSQNGRYFVYMFKEKDDTGASKDDYSIIAFSFNPGSELIRSCNEAGLCDVHVRNGEARFGRTNVGTQGEPTVNDNGITIKFSEYPRSYAFALLFSYLKSNNREGDELIAIFLSAFPFLDYQ
jgi:predicted metal-binding protein